MAEIKPKRSGVGELRLPIVARLRLHQSPTTTKEAKVRGRRIRCRSRRDKGDRELGLQL